MAPRQVVAPGAWRRVASAARAEARALQATQPMLGWDRVDVMWGRRRLELRMLARYVRDGWAAELVRTRFERGYAPREPATIGVELTNACQLRCPHCDAQRPEVRGSPGVMDEATFTRLVAQLREMKVRNLRIIGGGEPLLHPRVAAWLPRLRRAASLVTLTTNGQRLTPEISAAALDSLDVLEVSVAADNAADFARSRTGGDFDGLLVNLTRLRQLRAAMRSRMLVHIRVMLRPSDVPTVDRLLAFWQPFGDAVSTQRLQDYFVQGGDVFVRGVTEAYPPCVLPFRSLGVSWDGDVPLCRASAFQTGSPAGLVLGNIHATTLAEIWRGSVIAAYRDGHRRRASALMPVCHRCPDPQRPAWHKTFDTNAHIERAAARAACVVPVSDVLTVTRRRRSSARRDAVERVGGAREEPAPPCGP